MNNKANMIALVALTSAANLYASPEIIITPMIGYTGGGSVEDQDGNTYDMEGSENYTFAIETPLEKGRIGFFYSNQSSELETLNLSPQFNTCTFKAVSTTLLPLRCQDI